MANATITISQPGRAAVTVSQPATGPQGPAGAYNGPQVTVSTTPPASPNVGDIWIDIS